jgi:hypothetical protein
MTSSRSLPTQMVEEVKQVLIKTEKGLPLMLKAKGA